MEIKDAKYAIFDYTGKVIIHPNKFLNANPQIDLSFLLNGMYIVQLEIESQLYNYRFIKNSP